MTARAPRLPSVVTALAALAAAEGVIGADSRWMVPLGRLVAHGRLPSSIPYATAPTSGWHDVPALAELVSWLAYAAAGQRGLLLLQVAAMVVAWSATTRGLRAGGAPDGSVALVGLLVLVGCLPQVTVTRTYLFSFALLPLLLLLIEADAARRTRAIWLALPLLSLWSNLHGAVLVGWAILLIYVASSRARSDPREALAIGAGATVALFVTPSLWHTGSYYLHVLTSEAARRGTGLWAPLTPAGTEWFFLVAAAALLVLVVRGRPRAWEWACLAALVAATVKAERFGPWLLFVAAYPASRGIRLRGAPIAASGAAFAVIALVAIVGWTQNPIAGGAPLLARDAARRGAPVLADGLVAEQVALAGGRVWVANPLDAFGRGDQKLYLDWLDGRPAGAGAVKRGALVIVKRTTAAGRAAARDRRLQRLRAVGDYALYRVRRVSA